MNLKTFKWLLVVVFLVVLFFIFSAKNNVLAPDVQTNIKTSDILDINKVQYVKIAGNTVKVSLALTPETQAQGLSGKSGLKNDEGMLFVFNQPSKYSFWMKDMYFPIDIIWIAGEDLRDLRVVYIKKSAKPESYPDTFMPNQNAKYVLEVISSFSEKNNLKVGDKVEFLSS